MSIKKYTVTVTRLSCITGNPALSNSTTTSNLLFAEEFSKYHQEQARNTLVEWLESTAT